MYSIYSRKNTDMRFCYGKKKVHLPGTIDAVFEKNDIVGFGSEKSFSDKFEKCCDKIEDVWFPFFYLKNRERHPEFSVEIFG